MALTVLRYRLQTFIDVTKNCTAMNLSPRTPSNKLTTSLSTPLWVYAILVPVERLFCYSCM